MEVQAGAAPSGPGHWTPLAARLGGWGVGLSFLCLQFDLFASRLFRFSTWRSLGTLSKVQTAVSSPRAAAERWASAGRCVSGGCGAAVTNPACFVHRFGHFLLLLYCITWLIGWSKTSLENWDLGFVFSAGFTTSAKDLGEIAEMISSQSISIFLTATEFYFKICVLSTTKRFTSTKPRNGAGGGGGPFRCFT